MYYKRIVLYNFLSLFFIGLCLVSFLVFYFKMTFIFIIPMIMLAISEITGDELEKFNANDYYQSFVEKSEIVIEVPFNLVLVFFITAVVIKIIHRLSSNVSTGMAPVDPRHDLLPIENEISELTGFKYVKYHASKTFVSGGKLFLSLGDLFRYINGDKSVLFKVFHELSHRKSGDTTIGYIMVIMNGIMSVTFILTLSLVFFIVIDEFIIIEYIQDIYQIPLRILLFIVFSYLFYKAFYLTKYISKFKECLCDRNAHILMSRNSLTYSNKIFKGSESIHHPREADRIMCAEGDSKLRNKVVLYYSFALLVSIFPTLFVEDSISRLMNFTIVVNYIFIVFILLRVGISDSVRFLYFILASIPIFITLKIKLTEFFFRDNLSFYLSDILNSNWGNEFSLLLNHDLMIILVVIYFYLFFEIVDYLFLNYSYTKKMKKISLGVKYVSKLVSFFLLVISSIFLFFGIASFFSNDVEIIHLVSSLFFTYLLLNNLIRDKWYFLFFESIVVTIFILCTRQFFK